MFPLHLGEWQTPLILLGISTSSQQDGPYKIKPKHIKALLYLISKHIQVAFVAAFPTPISFRL